MSSYFHCRVCEITLPEVEWTHGFCRGCDRIRTELSGNEREEAFQQSFDERGGYDRNNDATG